jgi:hypothetical protein
VRQDGGVDPIPVAECVVARCVATGLAPRDDGLTKQGAMPVVVDQERGMRRG